MRTSARVSAKVIVTRPLPFAGVNTSVNNNIHLKNIQLLHLPLIKLETLEAARISPIIQNLASFDLVICVSTKAAHLAMQQINTYWHSHYPPNLQWFAVGKTTANILSKHNIRAIYPLSHYGSEQLLATQGLIDVEAKSVLIFGSYKGRQLLSDTLKKRGATVTHISLYKIVPQEYSYVQLSKIINIKEQYIITVTSLKILLTLLKMLKDLSLSWYDFTIVVPSVRIFKAAQKQGFRNILLAPSAGEKDILECITQYLNKGTVANR